MLSTSTKKSDTTSFSRLTAWRNLANWSIRLFDMSRRAVLRAGFSREIGPASEWTSRRKRTRHIRWRVHFTACNCTVITVARNLPSVWSAVSLSHTRARNYMDGHVSAKFAPAPVLRLVDKRHDWFSRVFYAVSMSANCGTARCCTLEFPEWSFVTKFISNNAFIRCGFFANMCDTRCAAIFLKLSLVSAF